MSLFDFLKKKPSVSITYAGGTGATLGEAIVIQGAPDTKAGIAAEYKWLTEQFGPPGPKWNLVQQSLIHEAVRHYDRMEVRFADGREQTIYFDITDFFGKR